MPEITRFYGIIISMYYKPKEHEPAHIHVEYSEFEGIFNIRTHEMTQGNLPKRVIGMVSEWLEEHQADLELMWKYQSIRKLPPLI